MLYKQNADLLHQASCNLAALVHWHMGQPAWQEVAKPTWKILPTAAKSFLTTSASSSLALPPRHMAAAVSPTRQGVLGITRTRRLSSPAASCRRRSHMSCTVASASACCLVQQLRLQAREPPCMPGVFRAALAQHAASQRLPLGTHGHACIHNLCIEEDPASRQEGGKHALSCAIVTPAAIDTTSCLSVRCSRISRRTTDTYWGFVAISITSEFSATCIKLVDGLQLCQQACCLVTSPSHDRVHCIHCSGCNIVCSIQMRSVHDAVYILT